MLFFIPFSLLTPQYFKSYNYIFWKRMEVAGTQPGTSTTSANHLTTVGENWITTYSWSSSSPSWPKSSARLSVHFRPAWPTKSCPLVSIGDQVKISISIALQNSSLANLLDRRMLLSGKAYASWSRGHGFNSRCVLNLPHDQKVMGSNTVVCWAIHFISYLFFSYFP